MAEYDGLTEPNEYTITLDKDLVSRGGIELQRVFYHECLHAALHSYGAVYGKHDELHVSALSAILLELVPQATLCEK